MCDSNVIVTIVGVQTDGRKKRRKVDVRIRYLSKRKRLTKPVLQLSPPSPADESTDQEDAWEDIEDDVDGDPDWKDPSLQDFYDGMDGVINEEVEEHLVASAICQR